MSENRFDMVRELVKDPSLRVTEIAWKTGYNKGHVSRLRKEAIRQALEEKQKTAVSPGKGTGFNYARSLGITVLRQPQEQVGRREPEPTAWQCQCGKAYTVACISSKPPKKQWVGLTAYEIQEIHSGNQHWGDFACAIEAKLREKNHG